MTLEARTDPTPSAISGGGTGTRTSKASVPAAKGFKSSFADEVLAKKVDDPSQSARAFYVSSSEPKD